MRFWLFWAAISIAVAAPASAQNSTPEITPDEIRAHVEFLADDTLEGRNAGSKGYEIAAQYVASQYRFMGLQPKGDEGSWKQIVSFREARFDGNPSLTLTVDGKNQTFTHGENILISKSLLDQKLDVEAPLVFVGFGMDRPDLGLDDYAGLDVKGKIVVILSGFPKGLSSEMGAHLSSVKSQMAEARGAIGVISVLTRQSMASVPWATYQKYGNEPSLSWVTPDGTPFLRAPAIRGRSVLSEQVAQMLFANAQSSFDTILTEADEEGGRPKGFPLNATARLTSSNIWQSVSSPNVIAMLPGSDPELADEYVLMVAHLDGLGISESEIGEDKIRNGAMDNAAGVATMLEVARQLAKSDVKPRRSILFAALTGEEDGLLGADYLAHNPVIGGGEVVAVVNFDMPVLLYELEDIVAFGAENSSLGPMVDAAAKSVNLKLSPDPMPEQGVFTRSDHYRFVQKGIPSVFLATGFGGEGGKQFGDFLKNHYHQVSDDLALPFNWEAAAIFAQVNYQIVRTVADADAKPLWYDGNFFGNEFAADMDKAPAP
ncbi:M28 family metallopeptidase [Parasphingorhabdus sp.]|uniref:M28 family metallopeptidase n=1 Tax=Parasphingorhabdus sp. TaxID=2709688 RepID=UPI003D295292